MINIEIEKEYCQDFSSGLPTIQQRENCVKNIYKILGYTLEDDIKIASVAEPLSELVISVAGSGKTTWSQIKAIQQKIYRPARNGNGKIKGNKILCLVYNKHNVNDIKIKHAKMVKKINAAIPDLKIGDEIFASTLHAFCDMWRKEYVAKLHMLNYTLIEQNKALQLMATAESTILSSMQIVAKESKYQELLSYYMYVKESMSTVEGCSDTDRFAEIGYEVDVVERIFKTYDNTKRIQKKYDFVDMLNKFYNLITTDSVVLERIQKSFEYVIADEVQDFTPLMWSILKTLVSNNTPLVAIGDDDQNIYTFRGANVINILDFRNNFDDAHIFTMSTNRRCPETILNEAKNVVEKNKLRFNKEMCSIKPGGSIELSSYKTQKGELVNIVKTVEQVASKKTDTTICYRNNYISYAISWELFQNDIEFYINSGFSAFEYELFNHVFNVFDILESPCEQELAINLYKVLPVKRKNIYEIFGFNPVTHSYSNIDRSKHFGQYDYGNLMSISGFSDILNVLINISQHFNELSTGAIFVQIFPLLKKYFWDFKKSQSSTLVDDYMEAAVTNYFTSDLKYKDFYKEHIKNREILTINNNSKIGVALSTFHSLKGLEFDNVIIADMDDYQFPNFGAIDNGSYSDSVKDALKESETRLWYVALTRSKNFIKIFYPEKSPSSFLTDLIESKSRNSESIKLKDAIAKVDTSSIFSDDIKIDNDTENEEKVQKALTIVDFKFKDKTGKSETTEDVNNTVENNAVSNDIVANGTSEFSNVKFTKNAYLDDVFSRIKNKG